MSLVLFFPLLALLHGILTRGYYKDAMKALKEALHGRFQLNLCLLCALSLINVVYIFEFYALCEKYAFMFIYVCIYVYFLMDFHVFYSTACFLIHLVGIQILKSSSRILDLEVPYNLGTLQFGFKKKICDEITWCEVVCITLWYQSDGSSITHIWVEISANLLDSWSYIFNLSCKLGGNDKIKKKFTIYGCNPMCKICEGLNG